MHGIGQRHVTIGNSEHGIVRDQRCRVTIGAETEMRHVEDRGISADLGEERLVFLRSLHGINGIHRHRMDVLLGDGCITEKALVQMGQVPIGITLGCDAFVDLEDVDL